MRKLLLVTVVILVSLILIKRKDMTWRQSLLKATYPLVMLKSKWFPNQKEIQVNTEKRIAPVSFYGLPCISNNGSLFDFSTLKGKKVLLVNTASDCGFTGQYEELEKLQQQFKDRLVILGFPANDFKGQEKKDDAAIAEFCKINYGVSFPLMKKSRVIKGADQHPVFQWLTQSTQNGWCNQQPVWNFCKYLVNEDGVLTHFFAQTVSPLAKEVTGAIE